MLCSIARNPTPEQKAEHLRLQKELDKVRQRYRKFSEKLYGKEWISTKEQIEQTEKEQKEVRKRMTELRSKLPAEYERH
ncbi:hypothetical protein ACFL3Q_13945 [Planctomycetota bacterium]